ncbi:MAG: hypothetical protein U5K37_03700 [Natrialbaceae archaeon]|nr:hypothetical protein [Natrialbaceae archaeon]
MSTCVTSRWVLAQWGESGYHVAWVGLVSILFGAILLDAFFNGINLFWPLNDRFYDLSGRLFVSNKQGLVQTFIEIDRTPTGSVGVGESNGAGTTNNTHYTTGFRPDARS